MQALKGTHDILPDEVYKWDYMEGVIRDVCARYGYKEIRTPIIEATELFQRGIGDTTDVVTKEMYTFNDKGNRSITLKPEGTAGAARGPGACAPHSPRRRVCAKRGENGARRSRKRAARVRMRCGKQ